MEAWRNWEWVALFSELSCVPQQQHSEVLYRLKSDLGGISQMSEKGCVRMECCREGERECRTKFWTEPMPTFCVRHKKSIVEWNIYSDGTFNSILWVNFRKTNSELTLTSVTNRRDSNEARRAIQFPFFSQSDEIHASETIEIFV